MNYGSSHGQVTLTPYQTGRVSLSSRSKICEVGQMVSARGRPYLAGRGERMLADALLVSGLPALDCGILTHASPGAEGDTA